MTTIDEIEALDVRRNRNTPESVLARVDALVSIVPITGCWMWMQRISPQGYGLISVMMKTTTAHRVVYEAVRGRIQRGMELDHLCRNRWCVNPDHLEPVTHKENVARGLSAKRPECKRGHPYVPSNIINRRDGARQCRECDSLLRAERRARKRKAKPARLACKRGHEVAGKGECRVCRRADDARYRARRKDALGTEALAKLGVGP